MLNVTNVRREVYTEDLLVVDVDASKDKLDLYAEHADPAEDRRQQLNRQIPNRTDQIEAMLRKLASYAEEKGLDKLLVVCEPTGGSEDQLFETAYRHGYEAAYGNGEQVPNASVIESGDQGKTDPDERPSDRDGSRDGQNPGAARTGRRARAFAGAGPNA